MGKTAGDGTTQHAFGVVRDIMRHRAEISSFTIERSVKRKMGEKTTWHPTWLQTFLIIKKDIKQATCPGGDGERRGYDSCKIVVPADF